MSDRQNDEDECRDRTLTPWQTFVSVLAAFFGVQSSTNRRRDFTYGKASHFIVIGLIVTVLLVIAIIVLVRVIMAQAV